MKQATKGKQMSEKILFLGNTQKEVEDRKNICKSEKLFVPSEKISNISSAKETTRNKERQLSERENLLFSLGVWRSSNIHRSHHDQLSYFEWCELTNSKKYLKEDRPSYAA